MSAEARIVPRSRDEFMAAIEQGGAGEFAFTAAGTEAKRLPATWFAEFMAARKPLVRLGARQGDAPADGAGGALDLQDAQAIAGAAREFQAAEAAAGRVVPIDQAVTRVMAR